MSSANCFSVNQSNSSYEHYNCVPREFLIVLTDTVRYTFAVIFVILSIASLIGNLAAIFAVSRRKYRFIQKTCIISLSLSDTLSTIIIATNNLETFSHAELIWTLGSFLCSFIPMAQMAGILASSMALTFIAMDRYRNVVHALSKRWNPPPYQCLLGSAVLWLLSFGLSYPIYNFFVQADVVLIFNSFNESMNTHVCISFNKDLIKTYYIIMVIIIFLPLLMVFLWFYYNIAALVWKHRKPVSTSYSKDEASGPESSSSTTEIRDKNCKLLTKKQDVRVERKIRTFKIIVALMTVFILCRLPYFAVYLMKLSLTSAGLWTWTVNYAFTALHIVNCALNPLLYAFLNQTLVFWVRLKKIVKYFTWEVCCFCFSRAEFEAFEKENPFAENCEQMGGRNSKVKFEDQVKHIQAKY